MASINMDEVINSIFSVWNIVGVYYVDDGQLYVGDSWDNELDPSAYTLENDCLLIDELSQEIGMELPFYRVTE